MYQNIQDEIFKEERHQKAIAKKWYNIYFIGMVFRRVGYS